MNVNKWRNVGLWTSLVSSLLLATQAIGALLGFEITNAQIDGVMVAVNAVLVVLTVAGVVSNPSNGIGYSDKKRSGK